MPALSVFIIVMEVFNLFELPGYSDYETIRIHYDINPLWKNFFNKLKNHIMAFHVFHIHNAEHILV